MANFGNIKVKATFGVHTEMMSSIGFSFPFPIQVIELNTKHDFNGTSVGVPPYVLYS